MCYVLLVVNFMLLLSFSGGRAENNRTFPDGFLIGVSTSAYQIEGAWNEDGKGENIWDRWIHTNPSHIRNNDTADISADSYHNYRYDITDASLLGVSHYRFSIPWTRILPTGMETSVNLKVIMHYQQLIDTILAGDMIPVATLYYNDLPQYLQDIGGWTNPEMVKYFVRYARIAFQYFPEVQYWITFNDPNAICRQGYGEGTNAPGISLSGIADYLCSYVVLKAHAAVYHLYKEEFPNLEAKVSIAIDMEWSEPNSDLIEDIQAAERTNLFQFGMYGHPIFIGNWPQEVIDRIGNRSKYENFKRSRLPEFTKAEIDYIKGTADFMAINTYSTRLVVGWDELEYNDPAYIKDVTSIAYIQSSWEHGADGNPIVPWGVRKALNWLKTTYNDPEIFITETGVSDYGSWADDIRIMFLQDYLLATLDAMYEDGVKVFGFTAKSLFDEFEWTEGYSQHFGFLQVDFSDPYRMRTTKKSFDFYRKFATTHRIPEDVSTTTSVPTTTQKGAATNVALCPALILFICYLRFLFK